MAAIEKICEFSGDYPGWDMYKYKRNHNIDDTKYFNTSCENIDYTSISLHEIREIIGNQNG